MKDTQLLRKNVNRITNEEKRVVNDLLCRINKMNVELSNHCVERENQRQLTTKQVEECLKNAKFENVVEISCKEFRHKMTPRLVIVSDKVYKNENGDTIYGTPVRVARKLRDAAGQYQIKQI